jgi:hypothetical protein
VVVVQPPGRGCDAGGTPARCEKERQAVSPTTRRARTLAPPANRHVLDDRAGGRHHLDSTTRATVTSWSECARGRQRARPGRRSTGHRDGNVTAGTPVLRHITLLLEAFGRTLALRAQSPRAPVP